MVMADNSSYASLESLLKSAKEILENDYHLAPVVILEGPNGRIIMDITNMWRSYKDGGRIAYDLGVLLGYGYDIERLWTVNEAYSSTMKKVDIPEDKSTLSLADDPKAAESIVITELTEDGEIRGLVTRFDRVVTLDGQTFTYEKPMKVKTSDIDKLMFSEFWRGKREASEAMGGTDKELAKRDARALAITVLGADITEIS